MTETRSRPHRDRCAAEVRWSLLRHRMLNAIVDDKVTWRDGAWSFKRHPSTPSQMARAVNSLWHGRFLDVVTEGRVELNAKGRRLLESWNERREVV